MSNITSLAHQLSLCINMQDFLNELNSKLYHVASRYEQSIDSLQGAGYLSDLLPELRKNEAEFKDIVYNLIKYIEGEHISYIHTQSKNLQDQIYGNMFK